MQSFSGMEKLLPSDNFFRVHKSYIVAVDKIEKIERQRLTIGKKTIAVSDTYKKSFFGFLEQRGMV